MQPYTCPIGGFSVDNCVIRINALVVSLLLLVHIFVPTVYIPLILAVDFGLRSFKAPVTLLNAPCRYIRKCFFNPEIVDGGSKLFAARIGFGFTVAILATYLLEAVEASIIISIVMFIVSFLNAAFNYCMGCHMHTLIHNTFKRNG